MIYYCLPQIVRSSGSAKQQYKPFLSFFAIARFDFNYKILIQRHTQDEIENITIIIIIIVIIIRYYYYEKRLYFVCNQMEQGSSVKPNLMLIF